MSNTSNTDNVTTQPQPTYLKDYLPPDFEVNAIHLTFHLEEDSTEVVNEMTLTQKTPNAPLILQGKDQELVSVFLDQQLLSPSEYTLETESLTLNNIPEKFQLKITTKIKPQLNTSLEGLYKVNSLYCTQCEPQGFRKITYYLDRPDVMTVFTTTIIADKTKYPVLLSNGNLIASKNFENNKHLATWEDPFKKPCYLFALVAGNLACIEDEFITQSNRKIQLKLYVDKGDEDKTTHAMASIKKAMKWDEENYGREYDLDIFMVVATHDFNMGAMENKGLNIFNSKYILANPKTATDEDYVAIERVIGHEYFHNWTGNRITCRDWFQLSLKESLTVFRDAQFSADMTSPAVVRINDANTLRSVQFPQDAGPMAHPVQPTSYIEINNFYTVTIYEKGAEVIRMLHTLLGKENFRRGMDLYFSRHDGQAVTVQDFVQAHSDANHKDLTQFMQWYHEPHTPELNISTQYFPEKKQYSLTLQQKHSCHKPFQLPFKMGLLNASGQEILAKNLELKQLEETFIFENIAEMPIPSLLRDFSAPVKIQYDYTDQELAFLFAHDTDAFAQWNAGQELGVRLIQQLMSNNPAQLALFTQAYKTLLQLHTIDPALLTLLLVLPNEHYLIEQINCNAPEQLDKLFSARKLIRNHIALHCEDLFLALYKTTQAHHAELSIGERSLKNRCLGYLGFTHTETKDRQTLIFDHYYQANNMTDQIAALTTISHLDEDNTEKQKALNHFFETFKTQPLVIDKWLSVQAKSEHSSVLNAVKQLLLHPAFSLKNPNKVRALIGAFSQNLSAFHAIDGSGYQFVTEQIIALNSINPMIGARLCEPFTRWKKYDETRQKIMLDCLEKIKNTPNLAVDIFEVVSKSLPKH